MSIASRTTSIIEHIEDDYNALERLGTDLTNVDKNIENIASVVNDIYDKLPKVTGTGSDLSLTPTLKGALGIAPIGSCEQDTTAYIDVGTWEQGGIDGSNGQNINSDTAVRTAGYIEVKPNVLYNISRNLATGYMVFRFYNSNKQYLGTQVTEGMVTTDKTQNRMQENDTSMTMTINNTNVAYMRMNDNTNNLSIQYTVSTQAPTPSYPQSIKIVTGDNQVVVANKNLVDWGTQSFTTYKDYQNLYIPAGTYTFSTKVTSSDTTYNYSRIYFYGNNYSTFISLERDVRKNATVTLTQNINRIVLYSSIDFQTSSGKTATYENIQLEKGSTATSYIAHQEQTTALHLGSLELCKIGDYQDVITGTKDNWKVVRKVGKVVLTGANDETWSLVTSGETPYYRYRYLSNNISDSNLFCNIFIKSTISTSGSDLGCSITSSGEFRCREATMKTLENWRTYLGTNNLVLYYQLATPTEETITDTTLINELNGLQELLSYDGTTNITITSDSNNAQMLVQVSALKGE